MKLSRFERTVLLNQFRILDRLAPGEWKEAVEVFERGYQYDYDEHMAPKGEISEEASSEALDIMLMFRALETAGSSLHFEGFDGNHEIDHCAYARRLLKGENFADMSANVIDGGNTHSPRLARYRRMLVAFKAIAEHPMSAADRAKVEAAVKGP